jgi:hypothetical protein
MSTHLKSTVAVNFHNKIPIRILHVLKADIPEDTGIIYENINTAETGNGGVNDLFTKLDTVIVGYSLATCFLNFLDDNIGGLEKNNFVNICVQIVKTED